MPIDANLFLHSKRIWLLALALAFCSISTPSLAQNNRALFGNGFERVEASQLIGHWAATRGNQELLLSINTNGSYSIQSDDYANNTTLSAVGRWRIEGGVVVFAPNSSDAQHTSVEVVDADTLRMTGLAVFIGAKRVSSLLYKRTPLNNGVYTRRWLVGGWFNFRGSLIFRDNGRYTLTVEPRTVTPGRTENGRYTLSRDRLTLMPDGASNYVMEINSRGLNHPAFGVTTLTRGVFLADSLADYAGQYGGPSTTIVIRDNGSGYAIYDGAGRRDLTLRLSDDRSRVFFNMQGYDGEFSANLLDNGLEIDSPASAPAPPGLDRRPAKMAEQETPAPDELTGIWYLDFATVSDISYYMTRQGQLLINRSASSQRGDFTLNNGFFTADLECDDTIRYTAERVGNQLILKTTNSTLNFIYTPASRQFVLNERRAYDSAQASASRLWANRIKVARINPGQSPAAALLGLPDSSFNQVFSGATGFAERQDYVWQQGLFWYVLTASRGYITVSAFDPNPPLDVIAGPFFDQQQLSFLNNGRVYQEIVDYGNPSSLNPVTPGVTKSWQRYRIDSDRVTVGSRRLDVLGGRRRLVDDSADSYDFCYDNLRWVAEQ